MQLPVDPARFAAYASVTTVMVLAPGPANLFAIAVGARRGRAAALAAVAGMNLGNLVWWTAAALGLSALALAFPGLFRILAWLGAAYVGWLGLSALARARRDARAEEHAPEAAAGRSALRDGLVVQLSNPKALLFTTAVLPPFIDPARPVGPQMLLFAAFGMTGDILVMTAYGVGGSAIAHRMAEPRFRRAFAAFTGLLLISAAVLIVLRG
jgi:threonine/homoserine/homoserine lactone efflux protein